MDAIDTLQVIIEANYAGLQSSLKQGLNQISQFVQNANGQFVNWNKILSGAVTPALMATIASTFAIAINQALQFQAAVQGASLNTTTAFGNTTAAMTNGAYAISDATGQSANDVENAVGQVSMVYKNYNDALAVTNDLAEYAATEHISLATAVAQALPLLQNWGVSAGDASTVLAALGESTASGLIPLQQMIDLMTKSGQAMKGIISPQQMIAQVMAASQVPGFTPADIGNFTDIIVKGVQNAQDPVNKIFGDMATYVKGPDGLGGAMDAIEGKIQSWGKDAQTIGPTFGLQANTISDAMKAPIKSFTDVGNLADTFLKNLEPLNKWFEDNETLLDKFKRVWEELVNDLGKNIGPGILQGLLDVLQGADVLTKIMNEALGGSGNTLQTVQAGYQAEGKQDVSNITSGLSGMFSGNSSIYRQSANQFIGGAAGLTKDAFMDGVTMLINALTGNKGGQNTSPGASSVKGSSGYSSTNMLPTAQ